MKLQGKPDFEEAMRRIEAWFNHETLDRPPVRFARAQRRLLEPRPRWRGAHGQA